MACAHISAASQIWSRVAGNFAPQAARQGRLFLAIEHLALGLLRLPVQNSAASLFLQKAGLSAGGLRDLLDQQAGTWLFHVC
jgi:hypothetical protein